MTHRTALVALIALAGLTMVACDDLARSSAAQAGPAGLSQDASPAAAEDCGGCYKFKNRAPAGINVPPAPNP